ncbi:MAG: Gx transporter family protein [Clostridia bacterium]|nr:Gx transporter family protein [Clostridia bacterium]
MKLNTKKIALSGLMLALALIIGTIEHSIPPIFPTLPFVRIGFSNIVIIFSILTLGFFPAIIITTLKSILVPLFIGNPIMIIYSLGAAIVSIIIIALLLRTKKVGIPTVSIVGAIMHNLTQLLVAIIMTETVEVIGLAPQLAITGLLAGLATGIISYTLIKFMPQKAINL